MSNFHDDFEARTIPDVDHLHNRTATFEMNLIDAFALRRLLVRIVDEAAIEDRATRLLYKRIVANIEMGIVARAEGAEGPTASALLLKALEDVLETTKYPDVGAYHAEAMKARQRAVKAIAVARGTD